MLVALIAVVSITVLANLGEAIGDENIGKFAPVIAQLGDNGS